MAATFLSYLPALVVLALAAPITAWCRLAGERRTTRQWLPAWEAAVRESTTTARRVTARTYDMPRICGCADDAGDPLCAPGEPHGHFGNTRQTLAAHFEQAVTDYGTAYPGAPLPPVLIDLAHALADLEAAAGRLDAKATARHRAYVLAVLMHARALWAEVIPPALVHAVLSRMDALEDLAEAPPMSWPAPPPADRMTAEQLPPATRPRSQLDRGSVHPEPRPCPVSGGIPLHPAYVGGALTPT